MCIKFQDRQFLEIFACIKKMEGGFTSMPLAEHMVVRDIVISPIASPIEEDQQDTQDDGSCWQTYDITVDMTQVY